MKVVIGVRNVAHELIVDVNMSAEEFTQAVRHAIHDNHILELTDSQGDKILVPGQAIGFTQITADEPRRVGFHL